MKAKEVLKKIKEGEFKFANRKGVENSVEKIDYILDILAEVLGKPGIRMAYVSDLSLIGDFFSQIDKEQHEMYLVELSEKFGFEVKINDFLVKIAEKLKD